MHIDWAVFLEKESIGIEGARILEKISQNAPFILKNPQDAPKTAQDGPQYTPKTTQESPRRPKTQKF